MSSPTRPAIERLLALLLIAALVTACSGGPQSQATESRGAPPSEVSSTAPAASEPPSTEPASESPGESVAATEPTAPPTPLAIPPKPAGVTYKHVGTRDLGGGTTRETYRITWTAQEGVASTFTVYGVTKCLRNAKKYDGKPCLVKGMKIPKATLKLIAQVPGSARTVDIAWKVGEIPIGPYQSVLIRASNAAGESIFTIAWSADVCWACTS